MILKMWLSVVCILIAFLTVVAAHYCILVRPLSSNSSVCNYGATLASISCNDNCDTFANILNYLNYCESDSINVIFLPGVHYLNNMSSLHVVGKEYLNISGIEGNERPVIQCDHNEGLLFQNIAYLRIQNLIINACGSNFDKEGLKRAAVGISNALSVRLINIVIQNSQGYGLNMLQYVGESVIFNSLLQHNNGTDEYNGGNANLSFPCSEEKNVHLEVKSTKFLYGNFGYNNSAIPMATGLIILMCSGITINIDNSTLDGNYAITGKQLDIDRGHNQGQGGNLAIILDDSTEPHANSSISIRDTNFTNGTGGFGGGLMFKTNSMNISYLNLSNCRFENNNATFDGGAVYLHIIHKTIQHQNSTMLDTDTFVKFTGCKFSQNAINSSQDAGVGIAFSIVNVYESHVMFIKLSRAVAQIHNCTFENNSLLSNIDGQTSSTSSVFLVSEQLGETLIADSLFSDNGGSAIAAIFSIITFSGIVEIRNNTGTYGAGISLCEASYIILHLNTTIFIHDNKAVKYGGGIYIESICSQSHPLCFFQLDINDTHNTTNDIDISSIQVKLVNNTADSAGSQLYGGNIQECYVSFDKNVTFDTLFTTESSPSDFSEIASAPTKACFCFNDNTNCSESAQSNIVVNPIYSGQKFSVNVTIVGQKDGRVPGNVHLSSYNNRSFHMDIKVPNVSHCKEVSIKLYSLLKDGNETVIIIANSTLYNTLIRGPNAIKITVPITNCPLGFEADETNPACHCSQILTNKKVECSIGSEVVLRRRPTWIGYHFANESRIKGTINGIIYQIRCPIDYCVQEDVNISTSTSSFDEDSQCAYSRSGLLCGSCSHNLSNVLGSSNCKDCSEYYIPYALLLTVAIAAGGIVLVIVLFICNFTVTEGTLSGLIFYANIFAVVSPTLLTNTEYGFATKLVVVFLSWLNLDPGIEFCLYFNLDTYTKMWGYFVYSVYLWMVAGLIIFLCKRFTCVARLARKNAVPVLATILLLSYFRINQGVIYALSYTTVNYPAMNNSYIPIKVWTMDASVAYLAGKHIPLFLAGVLFGALSVIYTLALLFIRPLQKVSHFKYFWWVNYLTPLIDAYSCPHIIDQSKQYWNGLLLLTRGILSVIIALYGFDRPMFSLAIIILFTTFLCVLSWWLGGIYKKWYLNFLCSLFLLNLIAIMTVTLWLRNIQSKGSSNDDAIAKCSNISVFLAMLMFTGITILHSYKLMKHLNLDKTLARFIHWCLVKKPPPGYRRLPDVVNTDVSDDGMINDNVTCTTVTVDYREPQLADFDTNTI